jgi:hypothetical protein
VNHYPSPVRRISAKKRSVKTADSCSVVRALQSKEIVLIAARKRKRCDHVVTAVFTLTTLARTRHRRRISPR